jgi:hypothetical protein
MVQSIHGGDGCGQSETNNEPPETPGASGGIIVFRVCGSGLDLNPAGLDGLGDWELDAENPIVDPGLYSCGVDRGVEFENTLKVAGANFAMEHVALYIRVCAGTRHREFVAFD